MKKPIITWFFCIFILFGFVQKQKITIYMIGDSTMANKPIEDNPERGWGMMFQQFFDSSVVVENRALNGRSTKTFISENRWQTVFDMLKPGDYVFIQFGHNDGSIEKKDRYTPPVEYKINLIKIVTETLSKKATPILCTPVMRRRFDAKNKFYDTHGIYPDIVRHVADSLKIPLIDLHKKSEKLIIEAGVEGSKKLFLFIDSTSYKSLPHGKQDNTHFSEYGATQIAKLAAESLKVLDLELKNRLKQ